MNFILVLSAYFYKRSKHGLTVSPPKKTLQGERRSPVSDPKVIENYFSAISLGLQQGLCVACFDNSIKQPRAGSAYVDKPKQFIIFLLVP